MKMPSMSVRTRLVPMNASADIKTPRMLKDVVRSPSHVVDYCVKV